MSQVVDKRVVEMQFDNRQFESGVQTSMSTLEKLKRSLNLDGAAKGLESVNAAAKNCDMSGIGKGVETVKARFSALQVAGVTAMANIANSAVNAGKRLVSAFTIEPIKAGFQEYETQMNAVQTILANTQSEHTNVKIVNKALDELNTYADKTIYNFTEMTRNIGTFTAAGVKLKTSVSAIKGIANLAAVSGSNSQQASTAMYQLSQAIASGSVKLQDWNSVVNAGMGGKVFQDALVRTSEHLKTGAKSAISAKGSFRESLRTGWLTTEVLTQTLDQFSTAADTEKEYEAAVAKFVKQGYSKEQAKQMADMARTAGEAATKVKTFTQLMDTLKEAAGSGWTTTWRLIIGDFEEAKGLWTDVSDTLSDMINKSSDARNKMVEGWAKGGGRDDLIDSLSNAFEGLMSVIKPIKEAFREIFPPVTSEQLIKFTENLKALTEKMKLSEERADKVKRIFKGVFAIFDIGKKAIVALIKPFYELSQSKGFNSLADSLLEILATVGDFFTTLDNGFNTSGISAFLSKIASGFSKVSSVISTFLDSAVSGLKNFGNVLSTVGKWISTTFTKVCNALKPVFTWIKDKLSSAFTWIKENVSIGDVFAGLAGGGIFVAFKKLADLIGKVKDIIDGLFDKEKSGGMLDNFSNILDSVHNSLESFTSGIKIASLVSIAVAVGILSAALSSIAKLDVKDVAKGLVGIGTLLGMLSLSFKSLTKSLTKFDSKGVVKSGLAMIAMAVAIKILASALKDIAELRFKDIVKGLVTIGVALAELVGALKLIGKTKVSLKSALSMIIIAESCKVLADALADIGKMSWSEIGRGLTGMGGALAEVSAVAAILGKFGKGGSIVGAIAILIMVQSLDEISDALKNIGSLSWEEIGRGLTGMGGALAELGVIAAVLGKFGGMSSIAGAISVVIMTKALEPIADTLSQIGSFSWDTIIKGLTGMGVALAELGIVAGALGKIAGFSGLIGAATILIMAQSLQPIANVLAQISMLSWEEIARGLTGMGGALTELAVIAGLLGTLAGLSGLVGAATILIMVQGLDDLANALKKFASMTWEEIVRGLVGMGGALTELAVISGLLGNLGGLGAALGAGSILLAIQGLDDLANALKKFGEMPWDEIKRGLAAMGAALGEVALGSLLNTLSGLGAASISAIAEPLGTLADSLKKWAGVTIPENLGYQLGVLAGGIMAFTLDGAGANAISTVAGPLGTLADSVKKWTGVVVPEGIGAQLKKLASGVKSFTFGGAGANAISTVAAPLGTLANSVKKWVSVIIPEGLESKLKSISNGVKSFTWAFTGGWSLNAIVGPLGKLPDAIKKWAGVTVPAGIDKQLKSISNGVKSFTWAFAGGWSIGEIIGPLSKLPDAIKKWNGIKVPEGLEKSLKSIANGVKSFTWAFVGGMSLSTIAGPFKQLASGIRTLCSVKIPKGIGDKLKSIASGIKSFAGVGDISSVSKSIKSIANSSATLSGLNFKSISSGLSTLASSLKKLSGVTINTKSLTSAMTSIANAVRRMMKTINSTIRSGKSTITGAMKTAMSGVPGAVKSTTNTVKSAARTLTSSFAKAISGKKQSVTSAFKTLVSGASGAVKSKRSSMVSAGKDLGSGLVQGINAKQQAVYNAAFKLGQKAVQGEKDGQKSNSPSKLTIQAGHWFGEGLVIGIGQMASKVYSAGYDAGDTAVQAMSGAIARISDIVDSDIDAQPTIRPVLDLSDVRSGAGTISDLFNRRQTVGVTSNVNAISSMMSRRNQNVGNAEVIEAINKLRKDVGNIDAASYTIGGITYDDGSSISEAVRSLVDAARIERRM